jgi:uncharacterized repeat protein (TIGR01451 family)
MGRGQRGANTTMVTAAPSQALNDGGFYLDNSINSGTGNYDPFLQIQNDPTEDGFNTDDSPPPLNDKASPHTHSIQVGELQVVHIDLGNGAGVQDYYEFRIDLNESNSKDGPNINLNAFNLFLSGAPAVDGDYNGAGGFTDGANPFTSVYSLDHPLALTDFSSGSGTDDGAIFIPVSAFTAAGATSSSYLTLYTQFTNADGGFEEIRAVTNTAGGLGILVTKTADITDVSQSNETIHYSETITNTGADSASITTVQDVLTGTPVAALGDGSTSADSSHNIGDLNNNGLLDRGEVWHYTSSYTTAAKDFVNDGNNDGVPPPPNAGVIFNTVSFSVTDTKTGAQETDSANASVAVDLPAINVEKLVSVDGGQTWFFTSDDNNETSADINAAIVAAGGQVLTITEGTPTALSNESIQYEFVVTNTGNVDLSNVQVTDAPALTGQPFTLGTLAAGASAVSGPVAGTWSAGDNTDTGTATGSFTDGAGRTDHPTDSDSADFTGLAPAINVEKLVSVDGGANWYFISDDNSETAADINAAIVATGHSALTIHEGTPTAFSGASVEYEFVVTNTGNVDLTGVQVTDAPALTGQPFAVGALAAGASAVSGPVAGTWNAGDNPDTATVKSDAVTDTAGSSVTPSDTDSADFTGLAPSINVEKLVSVDGGTNWYFQVAAGDTQDTATYISSVTGIAVANLHIGTPSILAGDHVAFGFVVQNTGNVALDDVLLTDNVYNADLATAIGSATGDLGTLAPGAVATTTITETATSNSANAPISDTASVTSDAVKDSAGDSVTPSDTDTVAYSGLAPSLNVEKLVSIDGGTNWYFQQVPGDAQDSAAFIHAASGIPLTNLHGYTTAPPTIAAGDTTHLQFEFVVTNTGNVALNDVTLSDSVYTLPTANIGTLAPGQSLVVDNINETAQFGTQTDTVTAKADAITDDGGHSVTPTDTDSVAYNGTFTQSPAGLTIGYWFNHQSQWNAALSFAPGDTSHALGQGILLGDANGDGVVDNGEDWLWIPKTAAVQLINSSASANDTRQILLSQAIALQLNVDVLHTIDPGYAGAGPVTGGDLLTEAVEWLRGQPPFVFGGDHSSGNIDYNGDQILEVATGNNATLANGVEYNLTKAAFTFEGAPAVAGKVLTSSTNAWQTQELFHSVDYMPTGLGMSASSLIGGNFSADGEGLKNALQAVNQNHLVTENNGAYVAWDPSGSPTGPYQDVSLNGHNDFWKVLHDMAPANQSLLHGIL